MALNFPSNPSTNDTYTSGALTYIFDGVKWKIFANDYSYKGTSVTSVDNITVFDLSLSTLFELDLDEDTTIQFTNPPETGFAQKFFIKIKITGTVSNITWPISITWNEGSAPTIPSLNEIDLIQIVTSDSGTSYYARQKENNIRTLLEGWNLSTAEYEYLVFDVSGQETNPRGIDFKPDGTKMYVIGDSSDTVCQYTLSTPWNVSTASYDNVSFSIVQDTVPTSVKFKTDGRIMYVTGDTNNSVYQYTLSTPWNISTATYDTISFDLSSQTTSPRAIWFKPDDGSLMYVCSTDKIFQYTLSTPWNIASTLYENILLDVSSETDDARGIVIKYDGSRIYVLGASTINIFANNIYQYNISAEWNLFTAAYSNLSFNVSSEDITPSGLTINTRGTDMYVINGSNNVYQYRLTS